MSARFTVADLAASGVLDVGRNRQRVAEAAGLPGPMVAHNGTAREAPAGHREPGPAIGPGAGPSSGSVEKINTAASPDSALPWVDPLLLAVLGEPRRLPRLEGEDALQAEIVWRAREAARAGRWHVLVVMRRNDIRVRTPSQAQLAARPGLAAWGQRQKREAQREGARAAALGLVRGFADLDVIWPGGVGYLEVKMPGSYPSPEQRAVHALLRAWGHRIEVVRSWDETLDVWRRWGVPGTT